MIRKEYVAVIFQTQCGLNLSIFYPITFPILNIPGLTLVLLRIAECEIKFTSHLKFSSSLCTTFTGHTHLQSLNALIGKTGILIFPSSQVAGGRWHGIIFVKCVEEFYTDMKAQNTISVLIIIISLEMWSEFPPQSIMMVLQRLRARKVNTMLCSQEARFTPGYKLVNTHTPGVHFRPRVVLTTVGMISIGYH